MRIADPEHPDRLGVSVEVRGGDTVGAVADRAAALLDRPEDAGVVTVQQRFTRYERSASASVLDDLTEALLVT